MKLPDGVPDPDPRTVLPGTPGLHAVEGEARLQATWRGAGLGEENFALSFADYAGVWTSPWWHPALQIGQADGDLPLHPDSDASGRCSTGSNKRPPARPKLAEVKWRSPGGRFFSSSAIALLFPHWDTRLKRFIHAVVPAKSCPRGACRPGWIAISGAQDCRDNYSQMCVSDAGKVAG
jgi:hypothetical protein